MADVTITSLFSGIGGLDLGLERGLRETEHTPSVTVMVEKETFCRKVLAKHWPNTVIYDDVTTVTDLEQTTLLIGGFPCQDLSNAGRKAGIKEGTRSGLFYELVRIAVLVRPRLIVLENVSAITSSSDGGDIATVCGEMAEIGYSAFWYDCIPATAVGAPHRRDRWFAVFWQPAEGVGLADPQGEREGGLAARQLRQLLPDAQGGGGPIQHEAQRGQDVANDGRISQQRARRPGDVAGAQGEDEGQGLQQQRLRDAAGHGGQAAGNADNLPQPLLIGPQGVFKARAAARAALRNRGWEYSQRHLGGEADGLSSGLVEPVATFFTPCASDAGHRGRGDLMSQLKGWKGHPKPTTWPTPQAFDASGAVRSPEAMERAMAGRAVEGRNGGAPQNLRERITEQRPWQPWEGDTPRMAPRQADTTKRLKALGNSVVPAVAEVIGIFVGTLLNEEEEVLQRGNVSR